MTQANELVELAESITTFGRSIRAAIRGLWSGVYNRYEFDREMVSAINRGFNQAWAEGMKQAGLSIADQTPEEVQVLEMMKGKQFAWIQTLAQSILENSKEKGGKLTPLLARSDMWTIRYSEVVAKALTMAQNDPVLEWVINLVRKVKKNCGSCLKLNGKRKRASYWRAKGIQPQNAPNPMLACGGWQ